MKNYKSIFRREFLKTGLTGGAVLAVFPFKKFVPISGLIDKSKKGRSTKSQEKLFQIAAQYGSEFGEVKLAE